VFIVLCFLFLICSLCVLLCRSLCCLVCVCHILIKITYLLTYIDFFLCLVQLRCNTRSFIARPPTCCSLIITNRFLSICITLSMELTSDFTLPASSLFHFYLLPVYHLYYHHSHLFSLLHSSIPGLTLACFTNPSRHRFFLTYWADFTNYLTINVFILFLFC